ncbi:P-loop containing nucleoside triphosphate hydrolase protein [Glonium stellatum]|uniref:P-loop containing nucleoside triphosphate hydrolase protein n=1 Tax=Glonium stellatum TaxID=574774 RepID=A0A8E2F5R1_9PEZI|nr:P-loop containing nucleoside triphosphate hydrolase protein [Glonium stellatum]
MHPKSPSPLGISTGTTRNGSGDFASEYTPSKDKRNNTTTFCVAYRISCESSERHNGSMFVDPPQWSDEWSFLGKAELRLSNRLHLVGNVPIKNMHAWLNSLGGVAFIVFRDYRCRDSLSWNTLRGADSGTTAPICREESIAIISEGLQTAINTVAKCSPSDSAYAPSRKPNEYAIPKNQDKEKDEELHHRFLYHHRHALLQYAETEDLEVSNQIIELLKYLEISKGSIYEEADTLFAQGEVKKHHIELLFCPNDIIISTLNGLPIACVLREWPAGQCTIFLECWYWGFDGSWLHRRPITLSIRRPPDAKVKIRQLEAYPIKYATQVDIDHLLARGQKWWNLRYQTLVSYKGWDYEAQKFYNYETRCMIDYQTYRSFHPRADTFTFSTKNRVLFDKWSTSIPHNGALSKVDFLLLPPDIHGYPLKEKKWSRLLVDNVFDVTWNKDAFERLVLPSKTKELIKASVMVRTLVPGKSQGMSLAGKRDDLIAGKGNGLIMLLHGGPGTGKTLTAESVAEIAEMPLYNVTCGDIGTKPDDVETYLQGVLALGKTWNCVLLLDEADVFLEERTLSDLDRNSLVSVFLRTLEYYEGILILTSNRVGTFDEAFKSRIQVALHYPTLDRISQKKIWQNFFDMLRIDEEDVNLDELSRHMDELADQEMNGRQIRNALTTARQLALFKKQTLDWEHLEQAIKTARDFNRYLKGVHGHTDEQWAREQKMR